MMFSMILIWLGCFLLAAVLLHKRIIWGGVFGAFPALHISDHSQGDNPREKNGGKPCGASSVGIVFGHKRTRASGEEDESCIAVSSLHFEPTDHVEWTISFREKQIEDKTIELM